MISLRRKEAKKLSGTHFGKHGTEAKKIYIEGYAITEVLIVKT